MSDYPPPAFNIIYAMDVSSLEPEARGWSSWLAPRRREAVARLRHREDRARCIGAGLLLSLALHRYDPTAEIPSSPEEGAHGKPYLPLTPDFHFNISHSGKWALCAVGGQPLGVDVEKVERNVLGAVGRGMTTVEREHLRQIAAEQRRGAATTIWTLKESYAKALGLGLGLSLERFSVCPGERLDAWEIIADGAVAPCSLGVIAFPDCDYRVGMCVLSARMPPHRLEFVELTDRFFSNYVALFF